MGPLSLTQREACLLSHDRLARAPGLLSPLSWTEPELFPAVAWRQLVQVHGRRAGHEAAQAGSWGCITLFGFLYKCQCSLKSLQWRLPAGVPNMLPEVKRVQPPPSQRGESCIAHAAYKQRHQLAGRRRERLPEPRDGKSLARAWGWGGRDGHLVHRGV